MRGFLLLCGGALASSVGNSVVTLPQDRNMINTMAFGRYAARDASVKTPPRPTSHKVPRLLRAPVPPYVGKKVPSS